MPSPAAIEWKDSSIDTHISQYPLATMAQTVERIRREFTLSEGGFSKVRLERLKAIQRNLSLLIEQIEERP